MKKRLLTVVAFVMAGLVSYKSATSCTNFLITRGASVDGSTMITYAADSHTLFGELYFTPAADHAEGEMLDIYEWDTGKFLGKIEQIPHTYSVIGNMNEFQLAISETTFGGRKELGSQKDAIMDYGSLIYVTLQRAKTAREAIKVMGDLVERYGYYSSGESFSISDGKEVWILEMIGKGEDEKGAVWVSQRIPDGYISGHANQARITTFPLNDSDNCIYAKDVISFAREKGWFDGKNKEFSFSDTYAPVDFGAARFCDARVYAGFNMVNGDMKKYEKYAMGNIEKGAHGYATNRIPLWIKPDKKLSNQDVMAMMRDHYEGTGLDMSNDIGGGPYKRPYRWRPMTWEVDGKKYCHERAIATQQTGFSFVAQSRDWMPTELGGILWFGMDDAATTCYTPIYSSSTRVPETMEVGNGDMITFSETSAFWIFNLVSNFAYIRYSDMIKDIKKVQNTLETKFVKMTPAIDAAAKQLWESGNKELAIEFLTDYSVNTANNMVKDWKKLAEYLLVKYKDGNIMKEKNGKFARTKYGLPPQPHHPSAPEWWLRKIVETTGDKYKVIENK